jgi:gallate decarboxylase subunit D
MAMSTYDLKSIRLQVIEAGEDKVFLVTGGKAHIGAVATFYVDHERVSGTTVHIPGHKEQELCERLARKAALQLKVTVTVIMGIHFDSITRMQIDEIVQTAERLMEDHLNKDKQSS